MNYYSRASIRLKGYDYAADGFYFLTICTYQKRYLFGHIQNGNMILNDAGHTVLDCWKTIPDYFPNTRIHEFVVMPNHVHGIMEFFGDTDADVSGVRAKSFSPLRVGDISVPFQSPSKTVGSVVRGFKTGVTKWFRQHQSNRFPIGTPVWQRNYYEHIICNEQAYRNIANYIINNPKNGRKINSIPNNSCS